LLDEAASKKDVDARDKRGDNDSLGDFSLA